MRGKIESNTDPRRERIAQMTAELFGGPVSIEFECDPEQPRDEWILFIARSREDIPTILRLERTWHELAARIVADNVLDYRLSVHPME
jgi:hypothetical protein